MMLPAIAELSRHLLSIWLLRVCMIEFARTNQGGLLVSHWLEQAMPLRGGI